MQIYTNVLYIIYCFASLGGIETNNYSLYRVSQLIEYFSFDFFGFPLNERERERDGDIYLI